ncbi:hypothetical protein D3C87_1345220 [compost metagenome]
MRIIFGLSDVLAIVHLGPDLEFNDGDDTRHQNDNVHAPAKPQDGNLEEDAPIERGITNLGEGRAEKFDLSGPRAKLIVLSLPMKRSETDGHLSD